MIHRPPVSWGKLSRVVSVEDNMLPITTFPLLALSGRSRPGRTPGPESSGTETRAWPAVARPARPRARPAPTARALGPQSPRAPALIAGTHGAHPEPTQPTCFSRRVPQRTQTRKTHRDRARARSRSAQPHQTQHTPSCSQAP